MKISTTSPADAISAREKRLQNRLSNSAKKIPSSAQKCSKREATPYSSGSPRNRGLDEFQKKWSAAKQDVVEEEGMVATTSRENSMSLECKSVLSEWSGVITSKNSPAVRKTVERARRRRSCRMSQTSSVDSQPENKRTNGQQTWEIEKFLGHKFLVDGEKVELLVKWKGYGIDDATWEPVENLEEGAHKLLRSYRATHGVRW